LVDVKFQSDPEFRPKSLPRKSLISGGRPQSADSHLANGVHHHHHEVVEVEHHVTEHVQPEPESRAQFENGVDSSSSSETGDDHPEVQIHELSRAREHRSSIFQARAPPEELVLPEAPAESAMGLSNGTDHHGTSAYWLQSLASQESTTTASAQDSTHEQHTSTTTNTTADASTVETHSPGTEIPSSITDELLDMVFSAITLEPPRLAATSHSAHTYYASGTPHRGEDADAGEETATDEQAKNVKPWKTPERDQLLAELTRRQEVKQLYVDADEVEGEAEALSEGERTPAVSGLHQIQVNVESTADEHESIERTVDMSDEEGDVEATEGHHQHVYDYRTSPVPHHHQQEHLEDSPVLSPESVPLPPMSRLSEGPNYTAEEDDVDVVPSRVDGVHHSPKYTFYHPSTQDLVRQEIGGGRVVAIRSLVDRFQGEDSGSLPKKQSSGRITLPPLDIHSAGEEDGGEGEDGEHKRYAKTPHPSSRKASNDELLWPRRGSSHSTNSNNHHHGSHHVSVEQAREEENEAGYKCTVQQLRNKFSQRQQQLQKQVSSTRHGLSAGNGGGGGAMHRPANLSIPGAIDIEHHSECWGSQGSEGVGGRRGGV